MKIPCQICGPGKGCVHCGGTTQCSSGCWRCAEAYTKGGGVFVCDRCGNEILEMFELVVKSPGGPHKQLHVCKPCYEDRHNRFATLDIDP